MYYHSPRILKEGDIVILTPIYNHVLTISGLSDRNGELRIGLEDGTI